MTTAADILNGTESLKNWAIRNSKFLILAGIGVCILFVLMKKVLK